MTLQPIRIHRHWYHAVSILALSFVTAVAETREFSAVKTGERNSDQLATDELAHLDANGDKVGESFDDGAVQGFVNPVFVFDFGELPTVTFTGGTLRMRYAFPHPAENAISNLDIYGVGWSDSLEPERYPAALVAKGDDIPSGTDGTRVLNDFYVLGDTSSTIKNEGSDDLIAFLNTRPAGAAGRYAFFRMNPDGPALDGEAMAINFNSGPNANKARLTLDFEVLSSLLSDFSAAESDIKSGESVTLNWQVLAGADTVTLEPGGDVSSQTAADGSGSIEVIPDNDTTYKLTVTKDGGSQSASVAIGVGQTLDNALLDIWTATPGSITTNADGFVTAWQSINGTVASHPGLDQGPPVYTPSVTPGGKGAVNFAASSLVVDSTENPFIDLTEFTLAMVIRIDSANPPGTSAGNWSLNAGILDADDVASRDDWGIAARSDGTVAFGVGNPDSTLISPPEVDFLDDQFHMIVAQWGLTGLRLYVDEQPVVVSEGDFSLAPRQNNVALAFGHNQFTPTQTFNGEISEVRFYNDAVSADQVEALIADMRARVFIGEGGTPILPKLFQVIDTTFDMTDGLKATITWNSRPGRFYSIEGSTDLIDWNPVGGEEVRAAGATTTFELDNLPAGQAQLYFRIVE